MNFMHDGTIESVGSMPSVNDGRLNRYQALWPRDGVGFRSYRFVAPARFSKYKVKEAQRANHDQLTIINEFCVESAGIKERWLCGTKRERRRKIV